MSNIVWEPGGMDGAIGGRIRAYRLRRGLPQTVLAGLVGRSESWLSQVERGVRTVDSLSVLLDLATALHVSVDTLIGSPWRFAPGVPPTYERLDGIRGHLQGYPRLQHHQPTPRDLDHVTQSNARLHAAYQAAHYDSTVLELPDALAAVDDLTQLHPDQPAALQAYLSTYLLASKLLLKLGDSTLAPVAADRAAHAAVTLGGPVERGWVARQVIECLLRADQVDAAERMATEMSNSLETEVPADDPALLSIRGTVWLIAAVIAARRADQYEALRRLDQADQLAQALGGDANHCWTAFGPTNVALHRVSIAAEIGDAASALKAAEQVDLTRLPEGLVSRRAQLHLDLAWAHTQRRRDADAILELVEAERTGSEVVRYHPLVRDNLREILSRTKHPGSLLVDLAHRAGVLD